MLVTLLGIVIEVREEQSAKAPSPMLVTPLGIVIEVREEQAAKAPTPIFVTLLPMLTEVKEEHSEKAKSPMLVTLLGITKSFISWSLIKKLCEQHIGLAYELPNLISHQPAISPV